ncbi:MAG TPA: chitin-binding protein [Micromonosporaceae bacterium]|nr:chitin-binding protein [Micromonosporaceae bacterium]HCU49333.1 chitin-binding protein [Micromonosporaceae bacterium]
MLLNPVAAQGHGAMLIPGSRTYLCYVDGHVSTGEIKPFNSACQNALNVGGTQPFYDWFGVLRSDGAGRTRGFIPDGALCSGGFPKYAGFDAPRNDWPLTHLTSGASLNWRYSNWAAHPGWFYLYVTKDGYDPNVALTWNDMEELPFFTADHPAMSGPAPNGYYYWTANLPANKTGRHVIYSVWKRSDSQETFYGCSDVVFDGGNGEVTGIRTNPGPSPSASPTPSTSPSVTPGLCTATYAQVSQWQGGFQGEVTVRNPGATAINGWTVRMSFANGQTVSQSWNSTYSQAGSLVTAVNASWNRTVAANATTAFGFLASWQGTNAAPTLSCTSG